MICLLLPRTLGLSPLPQMTQQSGYGAWILSMPSSRVCASWAARDTHGVF